MYLYYFILFVMRGTLFTYKKFLPCFTLLENMTYCHILLFLIKYYSFQR